MGRFDVVEGDGRQVPVVYYERERRERCVKMNALERPQHKHNKKRSQRQKWSKLFEKEMKKMVNVCNVFSAQHNIQYNRIFNT